MHMASPVLKRRLLPAMLALVLVGMIGIKAQAAIIQYSFTIPVSVTGTASFVGAIYTGTFLADTTNGAVTNFTSPNLLDGTFSVASLPAGTATFDGSNNVTSLIFVSSVVAPDGVRSFGFTSGFTAGQVAGFGLNPSNYFAFLRPNTVIDGGGTPVFQTLGPIGGGPAGVPLPLAAWAGLALGGVIIGRRRAAKK